MHNFEEKDSQKCMYDSPPHASKIITTSYFRQTVSRISSFGAATEVHTFFSIVLTLRACRRRGHYRNPLDFNPETFCDHARLITAPRNMTLKTRVMSAATRIWFTSSCEILSGRGWYVTNVVYCSYRSSSISRRVKMAQSKERGRRRGNRFERSVITDDGSDL